MPIVEGDYPYSLKKIKHMKTFHINNYKNNKIIPDDLVNLSLNLSKMIKEAKTLNKQIEHLIKENQKIVDKFNNILYNLDIYIIKVKNKY